MHREARGRGTAGLQVLQVAQLRDVVRDLHHAVGAAYRVQSQMLQARHRAYGRELLG